MPVNFYIQRDSTITDLELEFGIRILSVRGLEPPQPKPVFTREWATEHGTDVYIPDSRKRQSNKITIRGFAQDDITTAQSKYFEFIAALFEGSFQYFDTLQNKKVTCLLESRNATWYQFVDKGKIEFEVTLFNPSGLIETYIHGYS